MQVNRCFGCMEETTSNPCPHCGYFHRDQNAQSFALQPGTILHGKYLIGKVLGQGGFGITYIGWDLALARKVAIKEYFPASHVSRDSETGTALQWYRTDQAQRAQNMGQEMFLREARKMNKVASIPQVVQVQDMFRDNDTAYIIMNYVHGETLLKRIQRTGPMSWQSASALLVPVADIMQRVHDTGLIHRDLSPDNLMLQPDGSIRILDLGAAKDMSLHGGASSMQVAKGGFSPVEQYVMQGRSGPWTDVYSLAATIYYALTGVIPPSAVERMDRDTLRWDLPQLRKLPASVIHALQKGMAMQPENRIQSMRAFASELRKSVSGGKRWKPLVAVAAAALAAVALLAFLGDRSGPETMNDPDAPTSAAEAPAQTETPPQEADPLWSGNLLMSTIIPESYEYDADMAPVFNSRIARYQIVSVTFLDSLSAAGSESWDVSHARDGSVKAWVKANGTVTNWIGSNREESDAYDLYIAAENGINGKFCANLFRGFQNVRSIDFNGHFHTDQTESMEDMFSSCQNLTELDVSELKTDRVRSMAGMFESSGIQKLDVSHFDTSNVGNMNHMFYGCRYLKTLDLRNFNTAKVTTMADMFSMCSSLTSLNISSFDTSSVTDMGFMFSHIGLTSLDLSHFNTSRVTTMSYMFSGSSALETLDVRGFDTSRVTFMSGTFNGCSNLETVLGISDWDTSNVQYYDDFMDEGVTVDGKPWIELFE